MIQLIKWDKRNKHNICSKMWIRINIFLKNVKNKKICDFGLIIIRLVENKKLLGTSIFYIESYC